MIACYLITMRSGLLFFFKKTICRFGMYEVDRLYPYRSI
jgi:hypothetical protein